MEEYAIYRQARDTWNNTKNHMKAKTGFKLRTLGRDHILTPEFSSNINFNKMIVLNESAAYLWQAVDGKEFSVESLADLLVEKYEIDREQAEKDAASLADKWVEAGIAEL